MEDRLDELTENLQVADQSVLMAMSWLGGSRGNIKRIEKLLMEGRLEPVLIGRVLPARWTESLEPEECLWLLRLLAGPNLETAMIAVRVASFWALMGKPLERDLADFVWQCLEAARSSSQQDDYDLDWLSAVLAQHDSDKGFQLLETLLAPADEAGWEPISDHQENQLWTALREANRERAIRLVISLAASDTPRIIGIPQFLQGVLDQHTDHDLLMALATEDERQAEVVSNCITAAEPGFWPLAMKLLASYPYNEIVQSRLKLGARRTRGGVISYWGSSADQIESVLAEVEQILGNEELPETARSWLEGFAADLRQEVERTRIEEADEEIDL